jgi:apolipoprotein D and lipocalin family protein
MNSKKCFVPTLIISLIVSLIGCIDDNSYPPLSPVAKVDINRYLGLWYEIARIDHSFQKGCVASTAEYSLMTDGNIKVFNRCRKNNLEGEITSVEGKAWPKGSDTNAWLKVQFFWPFRGDYIIVDLDEKEYRYAVVGHPSRNYLWILSRVPQMDDETYRELLNKISKQGFNLDRIKKFPQVTMSK